MDAKAPLDFNDVGLFVRVVRLSSFSAAARERGVPVSTISRRIARLEAALGIRLLERTTRRLRLTDAGRAYFGHAERAVEDLAQGSARVRELQQEPRGRVRIVAPHLAAALGETLFRYLAKHPGVSIELLRDPRQDFDIAVLTGKLEDSADFVARELWRSTRKLLYASPGYLKARGTPRTPRDLVRHDCIASEAVDGHTTWTLLRGRRKQRVTVAPRLYVTEAGLVRQAALAGLGIAMVPELYCTRDVAEGRLVPVLPRYQGEAGGVHLLYRAHRAFTAAVRTCVDHLLTEFPAADPSVRMRGAK